MRDPSTGEAAEPTGTIHEARAAKTWHVQTWNNTMFCHDFRKLSLAEWPGWSGIIADKPKPRILRHVTRASKRGGLVRAPGADLANRRGA